MRIQLAAAFFSAALLASGSGFAAPKHQNATDQSSSAQTPRETTTQGKTETPSKTTKFKTMSVVGKVDKIEANKSLEVTTPHGHTQTFDLSAKDTTVTGAENAKVGDMVRVRQRTEAGKKMITIEPYEASAAGTRHHAKHQPSTDNTGAAPAPQK